jgi:hypothetical protein
MITRETRPMKPEDESALGRVEASWRRSLGWVAAVLYIIIVICALNFGSSVGNFLFAFGEESARDGARFGATGLLVGFSVAAWFLWTRLRARPDAELENDRMAGVVEVLDVEARAAVKTHAGFVLDVGGGQLLLLRGLCLKEPAARGAFPSRSFTLVRLPRSGVSLSVECRGEPLGPREIGWDRSLDLTQRRDGTILEGSVEMGPQGLRVVARGGSGSPQEGA